MPPLPGGSPNERCATRTTTGGDEVTEAGEAREGCRLGAERVTEPADLGKAAGDEGRRGVRPRSHARRHPARQRDDVLARAGDSASITSVMVYGRK